MYMTFFMKYKKKICAEQTKGYKLTLGTKNCVIAIDNITNITRDIAIFLLIGALLFKKKVSIIIVAPISVKIIIIKYSDFPAKYIKLSEVMFEDGINKYAINIIIVINVITLVLTLFCHNSFNEEASKSERYITQ